MSKYHYKNSSFRFIDFEAKKKLKIQRQKQEQNQNLRKQLMMGKCRNIITRASLHDIFYRDETSDIQERERVAKELLEEQIKTVNYKKEHEQKDKIQETEEHNRRLAISQAMYDHDNEEIKRIREESRRYLEKCWEEQIQLSKQKSLRC
jgi:hypothetical protein